MSSNSKSLVGYIKEHHHRFHFFFVLIVSVSISLGIYLGSLARAQTALPASNHPMWFTYYLDDSFYGNFRGELGNTVNSYLIWHYYMNAGSAVLDTSFRDAVGRGKNIIFGPDFSPADTTLRTSVDQGLDVARNYWNSIVAIYFDEPGMNKQGVESLINNFNSKVTARGLPLKPIAINFTESQMLNGTGYQATNIDYVGIEAYVNPSLQNNPSLVNTVNSKIDQQKAIIGNRPMFIVIQGYDRNGAWTNLESLKSIQAPAYLKSYNDPRMIGLFIFSYARPGGTRQLHSCIRNEHLRIWGSISGTAQPASIACSGASPTPSPSTPAPTLTSTPIPSVSSGPTPTASALPDGYFCSGNWVSDATIWGGSSDYGGKRTQSSCLSFCQSERANACNWSIDQDCDAMFGAGLYVHSPYLNWSYAWPQASPCAGSITPPPPPGPSPSQSGPPSPTYTIEGWVWEASAANDTGFDGPPSEPGLGGKRIYLHNADFSAMVSNTTTVSISPLIGYFAIGGVLPGSYNLTLEPSDIPAGYAITTGSNPFLITVVGSNVVHNFGLYNPTLQPSPPISSGPVPTISASLPPPSPPTPPGPGPQSIFDSFSLQSVPKILAGLACYFVRFALNLVGIAIILAGIIFIFSRGNPTAFTNAKKNLLYVIIGGLLIYGVYTIILSVSLFVTGSTNLPWIPLTCA